MRSCYVMAVRMPSGLRRDLRLSLGDASGYGAMAGVAEVYLPAFGLALGMSPVLAGLLSTVPAAGSARASRHRRCRSFR
jgi:hypothetical protein